MYELGAVGFADRTRDVMGRDAASVTKRDEIERILHHELEHARSFYDFETDQFHAATKGMVPVYAGLTDGTAEIRQVGTEHWPALEAYSVALKRFTDFIVSGIVPDDLKNPLPQRTVNRSANLEV